MFLSKPFFVIETLHAKRHQGRPWLSGKWKVPGTYFLGYLRSLPWENGPKRLTLTTPLHASN